MVVGGEVAESLCCNPASNLSRLLSTELFIRLQNLLMQKPYKAVMPDPPQGKERLISQTGTLWTAAAHIITGVIGSGVLSLAWSIAQLGWIAGPISILLFACVTLVSVILLTDCYMSPDPEVGPDRNRSYLEAVQQKLGATSAWFCGLFVYVIIYGNGIAYTITSAISMRAIQKANCYHKEGHEAACGYGDTLYMAIFGTIQIVMSQIPEFHNMDWLSVVAAIMSFTYSSIGFGLGIAKTIENGVIKGSIDGISTSSMEKVWLVSQALGDIAFAYPYTLILFEIQDTLRSPPSESHTMNKASTFAVSVTTLFYLLCGGSGYAAFGDDTPGNLLTGFDFYEPYWLIDLAIACIALHLVGGYQIYSQTLFAVVDRWFRTRFPVNKFINSEYNLKVPLIPRLRMNLFRLCFRTVFVLSSTGLAIVFLYFPMKMYLVQRRVEEWSKLWICLKAFSFVCLVVTYWRSLDPWKVSLLQVKLRKGIFSSCAFTKGKHGF